MAYSNQNNVPWEKAPIKPPPEIQYSEVQTSYGREILLSDGITYGSQFDATIACAKMLGLWCYDHDVEFSYQISAASNEISIIISFADRHYSHTARTVDDINRLIQGLPWYYMLTRKRHAPIKPPMPDGYGIF